MQSAAFLGPSLPAHLTSGDPLRASVGHLLSRAYALPCSTAAQAFSQLVQPTSRFQLALDALLPLLSTSSELAQRILVSFILYSLYAPHPIAINPFKSVLFATFVKERDLAVRVASDGSSTSDNEQLVWVLWKILKGDGNDIGPYSPSTLARSPLPPKLRAINLTLDEETYTTEPNIYDTDDTASHTPSSKQREGLRRIVTVVPAGEISSSPASHLAQETKVSAEDDKTNESIAQAMSLLLAARERVLTLSEQRLLSPAIPQLISPPMITSLDLSPLISNNATLAYPIVVALLTQPSSKLNSVGLSAYLDVLKHMPPILSSFDLLGRLLRDPTEIRDLTTGGKTTVADLIRVEVLGRFIHESINWLDNAERKEREGLVSDDRYAKGVQHLCRFYTSLLKMSLMDPASDADSTEMRHFTLRNSHFEEAGALFRVLGSGRF
ncbi:hypothetical protein PILCRDRAFT_812546 [Piloderma croceum F 1598]|uniref:Uncharacterized protein n=1 Tax=Piloderma croceum (strain F 1598) TaxID=765440 RepID=A0A0C3G0L5_PILCF|nr:hypothetical protein PILCRDRAFT_812546 [Piloderma croceum F 1598]